MTTETPWMMWRTRLPAASTLAASTLRTASYKHKIQDLVTQCNLNQPAQDSSGAAKQRSQQAHCRPGLGRCFRCCKAKAGVVAGQLARACLYITLPKRTKKQNQHMHIKHTAHSRCAICSGFEDIAKMSAHSTGICPADLAAGR